MYKVTIVTIYNTIVLEVEDLYSEQMQEIYNQPYVLEVRAEQINKSDGKCKKLVKEKK